MWALLIPLLSQVFGEKGPIGQYLKIKSDKVKAEENYKLELLKVQTEQLKAETQQVSDRLNATSQDFKQLTFWFLCVPVLITLCPWTSGFAVTMWANFKLIPEWFQILFVSVYSSIWGLPIAKEYLGGMFKSLGNAVSAHREYKLDKIKEYNNAAFYQVLRDEIFKQGISQEQVNVFEKALKARES